MFWVHCALSESVAPAASAALPEGTGPLTGPSAGAPARLVPVDGPHRHAVDAHALREAGQRLSVLEGEDLRLDVVDADHRRVALHGPDLRVAATGEDAPELIEEAVGGVDRGLPHLRV